MFTTINILQSFLPKKNILQSLPMDYVTLCTSNILQCLQQSIYYNVYNKQYITMFTTINILQTIIIAIADNKLLLSAIAMMILQ